MASYLEDYLDSIKTLPPQIQSNFKLVKELDAASRDVAQVIDESLDTYVRTIAGGKRKKDKKSRKQFTRLSKKIKNAQKMALELGDQKIDAQVQRLDQDLRRFEAELHREGNKGEINSYEHSHSRAGAQSTMREKYRTIEASIDLKIDEHEPVYCICRQVAFGDMIACDNPQCGEWFHYPCVGITQANRPRANWLCPECMAIKRASTPKSGTSKSGSHGRTWRFADRL